MRDTYISDSILYVGADDKTLDIFESQYPIPNGVSYNSYVIMDEKVAVMDTVDKRATDAWFENLAKRWETGNRIIWWYPIWSRIMRQISKTLRTVIRKLKLSETQRLLP